MKSLKPILLVLAGVLITIAMFAFKNEEPGVENLLISTYGGKITLYTQDGKKNEVSYKAATYEVELLKLLNELGKEGWKTLNVAGTNIYYSNTIYLQRTKP